jgi:outer membrane lipoprotein-sorting protein
LNLEDQIIVSDGKTIWNYSPSLQELQICDEIATTPEVNMDTFSPIQILQLYQHGFIPHEGYSTIIAQEHCHIIKFRSTSKKTNIKHLQLYIDSKSCQIKSIELEEKDQSLHLFDIMELTILENLTDHDFTFSIPSECKEIIDLR